MPDVKRFLRSVTFSGSGRSSSDETSDAHARDTPEGSLLQEITTFCEASNGPTQGNEYVHLPRIVETAESSPAAAKEAAYRIRKYLVVPSTIPSQAQYNAVMLMRILADNPGHTFTRNFDAKFVATIKDLLRYGRDWHVQHYLRQYLNHLEVNRPEDEDLQLLLQMWAKEKVKGNRSYVGQWPMDGGNGNNLPPTPPIRPQPPPKTLPDQGELAARVEEAKNSAKLLTQFVQTTPQAEMEDNDLIKEFVDRCRTSSRLIQTYIHSTNPVPDEDTLLTLIECNDEISVALSQQQRAMLKARKSRATSTPDSSNTTSPSPINTEVAASGSARLDSQGPHRERDSPVSPEQPRPMIDFPSTTMPGGRPNPSRTNGEPYTYDASAFEVQNPFADDYATTDTDRYRQTHSVNAPSNDRVRLQPSEQER
ncbi:hypothetical protein N7492_007153 [Penicillium capsulatum]|uniref:GAT domain-containing protein n=1 Tax=Penicillium capsulatum TaxID=69766 RepID=A0A9W9LLU2_9EURO|nr:hypothetical protein N7492_007153 [Penicillium capsulatum]KAJ6116990.1 hypothetical protein N7512_006715 [Penicillium capsulatum]